MTDKKTSAGRCDKCKNWTDRWTDRGVKCGSCKVLHLNGCRVYTDCEPITTEADFGCILFKRLTA